MPKMPSTAFVGRYVKLAKSLCNPRTAGPREPSCSIGVACRTTAGATSLPDARATPAAILGPTMPASIAIVRAISHLVRLLVVPCLRDASARLLMS
jgi:hypothetical protein